MSITSHVDLTVRVHGTDLSHIAAALKRGLAASGGEHSLSRAGESRVVFGGSKLVSCYCVADQLYLLGNFEEGSCSIDSRRSQGSVHSVQVLKKKGNLLLLVSLLIFILCLAIYMEVLLQVCCLVIGVLRCLYPPLHRSLQDEPENDLDVETLRALEDAINNFAGDPT